MSTTYQGCSLESSTDFEHRFKALVECSPDAIFVTDFDSAKFVEVNSKACELFGYREDELCGMTGRQLHPLEDAAIVDSISRELTEKDSVHRPAIRLRKATGELFWADLKSGAYLFQSRKLYVTLVRDISASLSREQDLEEAYRCLKETEGHLVRSSRLAALGHLAAGIAHEVNNPAASTLTNLEVLQQDLHKLVADIRRPRATLPAILDTLEVFASDALASVRDSLEGIQRIAFTVKGLRGFARIDEDDVENVDINEVVRAACNLVRHQVRHTASVRCELSATEPLPASRGRLVQVVLNLLLNAAQAIEEGGGTAIQVVTRNTSDGVLLRVEDDGPGVPDEIAELIFEPFFTTKGADRGTGLGLSVCADIIHRHRGTLRLKPSESGGACFEALIPLETGLKPSSISTAPPPLLERALRILVIDDEVTLVRAYRRLLSRKHNIVAAYGGDEALSILTHDRDFDLILCDMMMPGTDGAAVHDALSKSDPELLERLVFSSGGPTSKRARNFLTRPGIVFLEKPISSNALIQFISHRSGNVPVRQSGAALKTHTRELKESVEILPAIKQR